LHLYTPTLLAQPLVLWEAKSGTAVEEPTPEVAAEEGKPAATPTVPEKRQVCMIACSAGEIDT